jgi:N-acetyl sugar amidotransferase
MAQARAGMTATEFRRCVRCIMDTSDPEITFDADGVCNHCHAWDTDAVRYWDPSPRGRQKLEEILDGVRQRNRHKAYDAIIGLSGGLDSSYLSLVLKEFDLRVLAVHVDGGWNTELAVSNIQKLIEHCGFDLHTHVVNWEAMKNLQLAYFRSGVSNLDVPQDHVFFAVLHEQAVKNGCKVFMSGGNIATEFVWPLSWHGNAMDAINLKDIFRRYGHGSLAGYQTVSFTDWFMLFRLRGFEQIRPLNYLPYGTTLARAALAEVGWKDYPRKHGESRFTKYFQNYFLPTRFGYDKRVPHFSSRILSGDLTRARALEMLAEPLYTEEELRNDAVYIATKLDITTDELESFLHVPRRHYSDFRNWDRRLRIARGLYDKARGLLGRGRQGARAG